MVSVETFKTHIWISKQVYLMLDCNGVLKSSISLKVLCLYMLQITLSYVLHTHNILLLYNVLGHYIQYGTFI